MDKQQGPTAEHRELYSRSCDKPYGKEYKKEYVCICVNIYVCIYICIYMCKAESLCCIAEANTTL